MLERETSTRREKIDPEDLTYGKIMAGKYVFWVTAGMLLLLAWLWAYFAVKVVQLAIIVAFILAVPDVTYSISSSWGEGSHAWAAVGYAGFFSLYASIIAFVGFKHVWRQWRIAVRIRRGEL